MKGKKTYADEQAPPPGGLLMRGSGLTRTSPSMWVGQQHRAGGRQGRCAATVLCWSAHSTPVRPGWHFRLVAPQLPCLLCMQPMPVLLPQTTLQGYRTLCKVFQLVAGHPFDFRVFSAAAVHKRINGQAEGGAAHHSWLHDGRW